MQIGIRPLLMPSRLEDVALKIMWGDEHWALPPAAGATVELVDGNVYLAMSLRNSGSGIGVIHGWHLGLHDPHTPPAVVINEALEIARRFSGKDSVEFVNGVLDGIRKTLPAAQSKT